MSEALQGPLTSLRGIGPVLAESLAGAGIEVVEDLLTMAPVRYEDRTRFSSLTELQSLPPGTKTAVRVQVVSATVIRTRRRGFTIVRAEITDGESTATVVWYNQPYLGRALHEGRELILYGDWKPDRGRGKPARLENPELELVSPADDAAIHNGRIVPVHRRLGRLSPRSLRRLLHEALRSLPVPVPEPLPPGLLELHGLPRRDEALHGLHFPPAGSSLEELNRFQSPAQRRLILEELLLLFVAQRLRRQARHQGGRGRPYAIPDPLRVRLKEMLPFALTPGQLAALREIGADLRSPVPMARLLQGDVGCGKTVVALLTMLVAVENGMQAALMAPTELLAEQHALSMRRLLAPAGYRLGLLTGGLGAEERRATKARLAAGKLDLVVGTHTLIQKDVRFPRLGLVVIDEQQRFGVHQRVLLSQKGMEPDLLVMTATPIPRSLALTRYGDLDHSDIRDLPPGRGSVLTSCCSLDERQQAWRLVREQVAAGRQAYIVYPLVEASEKMELAAALEAREELAAGPLQGLQVGLLHGRLPASEREATMTRFVDGGTDVLVATTVIEVGVDVPNASTLVVAHAERFGLAQLHQLRGRVGRGSHPSFCVLLHDSGITEDARRRLEVLIRTDDGFAIAVEDLALRGAGELLGVRQHGGGGLRLADLIRDTAVVELARLEADRLTAAVVPESLRQAALRRWGRCLGLTAGG